MNNKITVYWLNEDKELQTFTLNSRMKKHRWLHSASDLDTCIATMKRENIKYLDFRRAIGRAGWYFKIMCDEDTAKKLGWEERK